MDINRAAIIFAALAQETRLGALRLLVRAGPGGLPAGRLSEALQTPHNTLSFHLKHLVGAGVVTSRRQGRSIVYSAHYDAIRDLIAFLVSDCCSGDQAQMHQDEASGCAIIELADCCEGGMKEQAGAVGRQAG